MPHRRPRGQWAVLDGAPELTMFHPGWTNNRETLALAIQEEGLYGRTIEAFQAAEQAELVWGWVGLNDSRDYVAVDEEGDTAEGVGVDEVVQATLAVLPQPLGD